MKLAFVAIFALLLGLYQSGMIIMKLSNLYTANWWVVLAPLGIPLLVLLCVVLSYFVFGGFYYLILRAGGEDVK